ncbi:hypothetical protein L6C93_14260, partial [Staphylococcus aureus]|nr:hypothetical protein [Staphylococcus aureus]
LLFHTTKRLYYLWEIPVVFLDIAFYHFLVFMAQRPIFQFIVTELIGWFIKNILFI